MPTNILSRDNLIFNKDTYEGIIEIDNSKAKIYLEIDQEKNDSDEKISLGNKVYDWYQNNLKEIKIFASNKLLELKNKNWTNPDGKLVTEDEFVAKIQLESIIVHKNNTISFCYQDNGLFDGHWIVIKADVNLNLVEAKIEG